MFPKGHATAYVMMAVRVGYFKVYYPLEFYATYFSVRADQYEIDTMIKGEDAIISRYEELKLKSKTKGEKLTPKEEAILDTLSIAIEMVQRGYTFSNISLEKSSATSFIVDKENKTLIPPFSTLDGLGESAATSVIEAREKNYFLSKEDVIKRTKLTSNQIEFLTRLGVFEKMSDENQLSLFDL
jgi:DNA polymerase-3 subunit alpha (Gram-positive type)